MMSTRSQSPFLGTPTPSVVGQSQLGQTDGPFDQAWLIQHFHLPPDTTAKFDFTGFNFDVFFKFPEDAKKFNDVLISNGCRSHHLKGNTRVSFLKFHEEKIRAAGLLVSEKGLSAADAVTILSADSAAAQPQKEQANTPFDQAWLIQHFHLPPDTTAEFDSLGIDFDVFFKFPEDAKKFNDDLTSNGCHPRYYEGDKSVSLNKFQEKKIRAAGLFVSEKGLTPATDTVTLSSAGSVPEQPQKEQANTPFDQAWLIQHFNLPPDTTAKFDSCGFDFVVFFKSPKEAKKFNDDLNSNGCYPLYFEGKTTVTFHNFQEEKIRAAGLLLSEKRAMKEQAPIPIDQAWLIKHFHLPPDTTAKFDSMGFDIDVYFTSSEDAKKFNNVLIGNGCHSRYSAGNTRVRLHQFEKEEIRAAGLLVSEKGLTSAADTVKLTPKATHHASVQRTPTPNVIASAPPFEASWLIAHFNLPSTTTSKYDSDGFGIDVIFEFPEDATKFDADLTSNGCRSFYLKSENKNKVHLWADQGNPILEAGCRLKYEKSLSPAERLLIAAARKSEGKASWDDYRRLALAANVAGNSIELTDNLLCAFKVMERYFQSKAQLENELSKPNSKQFEDHVSVLTSFQLEDKRSYQLMLGDFTWLLSETNAVPQLHNAFLTMNWDAFYQQFSHFEKTTLHDFVSLVYTLKDTVPINYWALNDVIMPTLSKNPYIPVVDEAR